MSGINLRERLAKLEHEQWAHWAMYMLQDLTPENIERWKRQILTPYSELTEREKDSDRVWADKVLDELFTPLHQSQPSVEDQNTS